MSEAKDLFALLGQSADAAWSKRSSSWSARARTISSAASITLAFASENGLDEEATIAAFLHATRIGMFDISWNVLCPGCGGVLDTMPR